MYWWKVTLDKTGAILSVEQVAERSKSGRLVCYVSALDKAGACREALDWHKRFRAQQLDYVTKRNQRMREKGQCPQCAEHRPLLPGKTVCAVCLERARERHRLIKRGVHKPRARTPITPELASDRRARSDLNSKIGGVTSCHLRWRALIEKFDALGPAGFRAWLVEMNRLGQQRAEGIKAGSLEAEAAE